MPLSRPKIAFVYDRINKIGGAEKVIQALHELYPQAPLYTSVYDSRKAGWARQIDIRPSFLQHLPIVRNHHEWFAWAMPYAFESFNFDEFDIVISITSAEAKGIVTGPNTLHLCYLLTPTRYLWSHTHFYQTGNYATNKNFLTRRLTPLVFSSLRQWDQIAANRPDVIAAISDTVARRTQKYYRRTPEAVIYPPVDSHIENIDRSIKPPRTFYLLVSRLVPYKRVDQAIRAFNKNGKNLIIIGDGAQRKYLKSIARDNIKFLGRVTQSKLARYYQKCQAMVFPAEEDFGIVSLEAQAAGKPVVAYGVGGASETVIHGKTGILYTPQTSDALIRAVNLLESKNIKPQACQKNAARFSKDIFKRQFKKFVEDAWQNHQNQ